MRRFAPLVPEQVEAVAVELEKVGERDVADLVRFLAATGARLQEALRLTRADVRPAGFVVVGLDARWVRLPPGQRYLLRRRGLLFPVGVAWAVKRIQRAMLAVGLSPAQARVQEIRRYYVEHGAEQAATQPDPRFAPVDY